MIRRILLSVALLIAIVLAIPIVWMAWESRPGGPMNAPAIADGLRWGKADMTNRLLRLFPLGSDAGRLRERLRSEHFDLVGQNSASREWGELVCNLRVTVNWRTDSADRLIETTGEINEAGCL